MKAVAVTRNCTLAEPGGIVSEAGRIRLGELDVRLMIPPIALRVIVQVPEESGVIVPGLQTMELIDVAGKRSVLTVTPPPLAVTAIASPAGDAPKASTILIGTAFALERVTDTVATTPSEIGLEFSPQATHVRMPPPPEHDNVLPAVDSAGPPVMAKFATFAAGYASFHWIAAGWLPPKEVKERLREAVPPEAAAADESVKLFCALSRSQDSKIAVMRSIELLRTTVIFIKYTSP